MRYPILDLMFNDEKPESVFENLGLVATIEGGYAGKHIIRCEGIPCK